MSVLINGMKMPKNCYECQFSFARYDKLPSKRGCTELSHTYKCCITDKALTATKRNRFCPLVEVDEVEE